MTLTIKRLKFPTLTELKCKSGNEENYHKSTYFLFKVCDSVYGQLTYNEDNSKEIRYDLIIDGYSGNNEYRQDKCIANTTEYKKLQKRIEGKRLELLNSLANPKSHMV